MCDLSRMNGRMTITSWLARARIAHTRKMHWKHVYRRLFDFTSILCLKYFCNDFLFSVFVFVRRILCRRTCCVRIFVLFICPSAHRSSNDFEWTRMGRNGKKKLEVKSYGRIEQSAMLRSNDVSFVRFNWARRCCCCRHCHCLRLFVFIVWKIFGGWKKINSKLFSLRKEWIDELFACRSVLERSVRILCV